MRVLVVEDDRVTGDYIRKGLLDSGHEVDLARTGQDGLNRALAGGYDVIVQDRDLPPPDGLTIVRMLRAARIDTPVLMLTAIDHVAGRVEALKAGADDHMGKPFALSELLARLEARARRPAAPAGDPNLLRYRDLELDVENGTVRRGGRLLDLQQGQVKLLRYMMRNPGRLLTRALLLEHVYNMRVDPNSNIVEAQVRKLRQALEADGAEPLVHTVRGAGYRLGPP